MADPETLGSTGQVHVTWSALRAYRQHRGLDRRDVETARRELLELVLGARRQSRDTESGLERWRYRSHTDRIDLELHVARQGPIASITHLHARYLKPRSRARR